MPLPIETFIADTVSRLRGEATRLNDLADQLAGLDLAQELIMNADILFSRILAEAKAKTEQVKTLTADKADLQAKVDTLTPLAITADEAREGEDFVATLPPVPPADTGDAGAGGPAPTPPAGEPL